MDNRFLDKVVDQIVRETRIDYDRRVIKTPHLPLNLHISFSHINHFPSLFPLVSFSDHCKDVYGLNEQEIDYVWKVYRGIIKDKKNSNG